MHLLIVRKNKKDGNFIILSGNDRYEYLIKHTNKKYAPCIPQINLDSLTPASWSILRSFFKQEPRFEHLSRSQQFKVLILAIRYKKTVISSMKAKIDEILAHE